MGRPQAEAKAPVEARAGEVDHQAAGRGNRPGSLGPASGVSQLHRSIGNRAVGRLLAGAAEPATAPGGDALPGPLQARVEALAGVSLAGVRVHRGSSRPGAMGAHAFTAGREIHLGPGEERHLPHEAWHVVQQMQGRVPPEAAPQPAADERLPVNVDPRLEHEADRMGAVAARPGPGPGRGPGPPGTTPVPTHLTTARHLVGGPGRPVVQGAWFRMTSVLDEQDEREVGTIRQVVGGGDLVGGFGIVVSKYPLLVRSFLKLIELSRRSPEVVDAIENLLFETWEDPQKAYTAAEVIELLEDNEVILEAAEQFLAEDDPDVEELTEQFKTLSLNVPFRSDVDGGREEHRVFWGQDQVHHINDVIVASNPKPLKLVCGDKQWEGYPLSATLVTRLTGLRKTAKLALYGIGGNSKRGLTGSRTAAKMKAFRSALAAIAKVLANLGGATHTATLLPATDLSASTNYGSNSYPTEGLRVVANPLTIKSATAGSKPVDGRLMKSIRNRAGPASKSYVQMHLLNDLVFGPGQLWNLTPGPKQSNADMERKVEDPLKRAILGKGLVVSFEAQVKYKNDPMAASDTEITHNPDKFRFDHIDFKATQFEYDETQTQWVKAAQQDEDVEEVDGRRITWRYGSLTPLTPKPSIFNKKNKQADLTAVGIQPAAAKRIIAFVKAKPNWRPSGGKKQAQLAAAVKKWDGQSRIPNISSWKATDVYWDS